MSGETADRPASVSSLSSVSSISLVEIKSESRLVLKAFLRKSLATPLEQRPGTVGGTYKDPQKYSVGWKPHKKEKDGRNSQDEDDGSADERTSTLKKLIKRIPTTVRRPAKDGDPAPSSNGTLERDGRPNGVTAAVQHIRDQLEDEFLSPSSTSSEDDSGKEQKKGKKKKKKKLRKRMSDFFRIKSKEKDKKEDKEKEDGRPQRPTSLHIPEVPEPVKPLDSPNHPPEFYEEVAERLDKLAQRSHSIKSIKRPSPRPLPSPPKPAPSDKPPPADKEAVLQKLFQVLSMEGDAINRRIQSDQFLRSSLARLSYPSFAKLLDAFASSEVAAAPPPMAPVPASPTLRRVAVTMEVSRRVVTATGTQRMQGYAERYMENFAPWVKKQGGWENIVEAVELEYD